MRTASRLPLRRRVFARLRQLRRCVCAPRRRPPRAAASASRAPALTHARTLRRRPATSLPRARPRRPRHLETGLLGINPFFVAVVVVPTVTNAAEIFISIGNAKKKRRRGLTLLFNALYGGVSVNNCISAGVFFFLMFVKDVEWSFGAETCGLIFITAAVGSIGATHATLPLYMAPVAAALFPITLLIIWVLRFVM